VAELVARMLSYQTGQLGTRETLELFAALIRSGQAWEFQGAVYGRPATDLIERGLITPEGEITQKGYDLADQAGRCRVGEGARRNC
jgi:hypothetical protein